MHQVMFRDKDDDVTGLTHIMALVAAADWESNIDTNVSVAFTVSPYFEQYSRPSPYVAFYNDANLKEGISKLIVRLLEVEISLVNLSPH